MYISEIRTKAPADERMPLERKFYDTLEKLKIPSGKRSLKTIGVRRTGYDHSE